MGWRDRDWARFNDAERKAYYETGAARGPASGRSIIKPGAGVAIAVSAVLFGLGQLPRSDPLVPSLNFEVPSFGTGSSATLAESRTFPLDLPETATTGSTLTITGADAGSGQVTIRGHWNAQPWKTIATTTSGQDGAWTGSFRLEGRGMLNVRVLLPSGDILTGHVRVTPQS
jgi:hypothetical protein